MKKVSILLLALSLVVGFTFLGVADMSDSEMDKGLDASPAFEGEEGHWEHESGAPRFDTDNGRIAIDPEEPGENSSGDSAVVSHSDDSLVKTDKDDDFGE